MEKNSGCATIIGMYLCIILAFVSFFYFIMNEAVIVGIISMIVFCAIGLIIFNNGPEELKDQVQEEQRQKEYRKMNGGYRCPSCGKMAGHPIGMLDKGISVGTLGLASNKIGKTYKCANCGYMW